MPALPASTVYWIALVSLGLCVLLSALRRQTATQLKNAQQKLLDERKERERALSELVLVRSGRSTAEKQAEAAQKEAEAAKQEASAAKASLGALETLEASVKQLEAERDAAKASAEQAFTAKNEALAAKNKTEAELSEAKQEVLIAQATVTEMARSGEEARGLVFAAEKTISDLQAKLRQAEQTKKLVETRDAEIKAAAGREQAQAAELSTARARVKALEEELTNAKNAAAATPPPPTVTPVAAAPATGGATDFLVALDADPYTNRGQKETIRMTYNQFTAKKRSS